VSSPSDRTDVPSEAAAVARRYQRLERPLVYAVAFLFAGVVGAAVLFLPLLVAVFVVALMRVPVFRIEGTARLVSESDSETVQSEFESAIPPVLPFQWRIADDIHTAADSVTYDFSYMWGLRSASVTVEIDSRAADDGDSNGDLELRIMENGKPRSTYTVSIHECDSETVANIEWVSDSRFELRRLPQWLVAERYRTDALTAQGFTVVERKASLSL
jgi:hypothetical protein